MEEIDRHVLRRYDVGHPPLKVRISRQPPRSPACGRACTRTHAALVAPCEESAGACMQPRERPPNVSAALTIDAAPAAQLGKGAYGIVWRAEEKKSPGSLVALKKIFDAFQNSTDAQRTYREVMFLQAMKGHENIISLLNVLKADNDRDLYLVFEYMDTDLNAAIKANILEEVHKKYILYQCFAALQHMHERDLVHRDMKPANLLLNASCLMKVCDFGLARSVSGFTGNDGSDREAVMTDYVATRWYRAPEILIGSSTYTFPVDMWSVGCILAECLLGRPFFTGTTTMNQLEKIIETLGWPSMGERASWNCEEFAGTIIDSCHDLRERHGGGDPLRNPQSYEDTREQFKRQLPPGLNDEALDLLLKLLMYHPSERISALGGMAHPYCQGAWVPLMVEPPHAREKEPAHSKLQFNDSVRRTTNDYREGIYKMAAQNFAVVNDPPKLSHRPGYSSSQSQRSQRSSRPGANGTASSNQGQGDAAVAAANKEAREKEKKRKEEEQERKRREAEERKRREEAEEATRRGQEAKERAAPAAPAPVGDAT
jgi:mitogen-activated protein kinase 15